MLISRAIIDDVVVTSDPLLQEMTEQGIPMLILFYHPEQPEVKEIFKERVKDELKDQRGGVCLDSD